MCIGLLGRAAELIARSPCAARELGREWGSTIGLMGMYGGQAVDPGARYAPAAFVGFELNADVTERVRRLRPPVLLVWGSHPHTNPHSERHAFEAARPDWQSTVMDNTGDLPHDEAPDAFAALVSRFLDQTSTAA